MHASKEPEIVETQMPSDDVIKRFRAISECASSQVAPGVQRMIPAMGRSHEARAHQRSGQAIRSLSERHQVMAKQPSQGELAQDLPHTG